MATAIKVSSEIVDLARGEGRVMGRSIAGQIEHWARLGRALERSPGFDYRRVHTALSARLAFDELGADEQAVALAELESYLEALPRDRDARFFAKLRAAGVRIQGETGSRRARPASRRRA